MQFVWCFWSIELWIPYLPHCLWVPPNWTKRALLFLQSLHRSRYSNRDLLTSKLWKTFSPDEEGEVQKEGRVTSWFLWKGDTTFGRKAGSVRRITLSSRIWVYGWLCTSAESSPTLLADVIATKNTVLNVRNLIGILSIGSNGSFVRALRRDPMEGRTQFLLGAF